MPTWQTCLTWCSFTNTLKMWTRVSERGTFRTRCACGRSPTIRNIVLKVVCKIKETQVTWLSSRFCTVWPRWPFCLPKVRRKRGISEGCLGFCSGKMTICDCFFNVFRVKSSINRLIVICSQLIQSEIEFKAVVVRFFLSCGLTDFSVLSFPGGRAQSKHPTSPAHHECAWWQIDPFLTS